MTDVAQAADPGGALLQYGAIGVLALLAVLAVKVLYGRAAEDAAYHRQRADRLEDELRALNSTMREQYIAVIGPATEAIADAVAALRVRR